MATPRTVAFHTLGCKLNYSETSALARLFEQSGYLPVKFEEAADIFVLNTCSVTEQADKECKKIVRQALRRSPDAFVVVTGCYAQLKPQEIAEIPGVDLVVGAGEKFRFLSAIVPALSSRCRMVAITNAPSVPSRRRGARAVPIPWKVSCKMPAILRIWA
jgi:threonylcarbamoyladenosine tRNA methylthiotransferase MtaB